MNGVHSKKYKESILSILRGWGSNPGENNKNTCVCTMSEKNKTGSGITREDALPYVIEERTEWLKLEATHSRENIKKIWEDISDIDVIRKRVIHIPDILTKQNKFEGEFDFETRDYLRDLKATLPKEKIKGITELLTMKRMVIGAITTGGLAVIGTAIQFFLQIKGGAP